MAYGLLWYRQNIDLKAVAPGDSETFAERAFNATARTYCASRFVHGRVKNEPIIDRWNMLRSACGVVKVQRPAQKGQQGQDQDQDQQMEDNNTQAQAQNQAQDQGQNQTQSKDQEEWEFVN